MRLIALFGPKGSGKDECARILRELYVEARPRPGVEPARQVDLYTDRIEFAAPLRDACDALGFPTDAVRWRKDEPCAYLDGRPGRDLLVAVGEAVRALAPAHFAQHAVALAEEAAAAGWDLVVISDGRLPVEARTVRAAGGLCVWVHRPEAHERRGEDRVCTMAAHGLCHLEVDNSGDLDRLRGECRRVLDAALTMPEVLL